MVSPIQGIAVLGALVLCLSTIAVEGTPKVDPDTGLIRVIYFGEAMMGAGFITPFISQDPMMAMTPVPFDHMTLQDNARALRMYFPRHEREITEGYDAIITADAAETHFPHKIQNWIKSGVIESGLGLLMGGGPQSFGGYGPMGAPGWDGSIVEEVLPVICLTDWTYNLGHRYRLIPMDGYHDHPLVKNIPWSQVPLFCRNRVLPKQGSVVVDQSDNYPPGSPILIYTEMGDGMSEAFVFDWGGNGPQDFHRWDYAPMVISNLIYYIVRVSIPEDTSLMLKLRTMLTKYSSLRRYALSIIDFAEKFGANVNRAEAALRSSSDERREVGELYLGGDHQDSLAKLEDALDSLKAVSELAMEAKDEALFWVYVIEWFTVTGTAMFSGAILWTLMVKKANYREVAQTRLHSESR
jgi:uncharacterized membrane protein